jgi:hypothetical protein
MLDSAADLGAHACQWEEQITGWDWQINRGRPDGDCLSAFGAPLTMPAQNARDCGRTNLTLGDEARVVCH